MYSPGLKQSFSFREQTLKSAPSPLLYWSRYKSWETPSLYLFGLSFSVKERQPAGSPDGNCVSVWTEGENNNKNSCPSLWGSNCGHGRVPGDMCSGHWVSGTSVFGPITLLCIQEPFVYSYHGGTLASRLAWTLSLHFRLCTPRSHLTIYSSMKWQAAFIKQIWRPYFSMCIYKLKFYLLKWKSTVLLFAKTEVLSCNIIHQRCLSTLSFDTHRAARQPWSSSIHAHLQRVHSGVDVNRSLSSGAAGSLHTGALLTTRLSSCPLSPSVCVSLLLSGSTTSQGMFQHATNSWTECMSLLLEHRGRSRGLERGETQRKAWLSLLQSACTAFTLSSLTQEGVIVWSCIKIDFLVDVVHITIIITIFLYKSRGGEMKWGMRATDWEERCCIGLTCQFTCS